MQIRIPILSACKKKSINARESKKKNKFPDVENIL